MNIKGVGIGRGVAVGPVIRMAAPLPEPSDAPRAEGIDAETEIIRVERSLALVNADLNRRAEEAANGDEGAQKAAPILQAIAMFASDLDAATRRQLTRGERLMELLKQPQSTPYAMEDQVASIWMGTKGYLDDIEVEDVLRFERGLLDHLHANSTVLDTLAATGDLTSETEEALKNAVEEFHHQWISAGRGTAGLEDGEVVAERTREEISRGRTSEKA